MPDSPWFICAEDAWRAALRRIGGVLCIAFGRMRAEPLPFVVGAGCLYLWKLAFKLLPLERLTGGPLHAAAWSWSIAGALLELALFVVVADAMVRGDGERRVFGPGFPRRFLRTLPYAFCYYLCFGQAWGLLGWGVQWLAEPVFGKNSFFLWTASYHVGALPLLYLLGRFGFTLAGAAAGERVSFRRSWELSRPAAGALFLTALAWWAALRLPSDILVNGFPSSPFTGFYFRWLDLPARCGTAVLSWAVGAAWYRALRGVAEGPTPAG
ncbi:hypothetical protein BerOc1_01361 [Pseudodesulfovibrio hydrargyri]|uniref:Uncharacterized protein n=1 Tax=Pseudodesulfovibrio hydrargyri TaxID=2125990 RepID=A0A1J5MU96_9BACT|nr:hypothetical protein [Pseudodesulfovibrio hydrargyri]OIQ49436.1 hypothetical protein BerOc1_01361 [Pseudodesulfovibrio hydrargyri]